MKIARLGAAAALLAAIAVAAPVAASPASTAGTLRGSVGPGFTIKLTSNGRRVTTLKAGTYTIVVSDKGSSHSFVLEKSKGGSFEKTITGVSFTGTKTVQVKLTAGKWEYYCRPHESVMHGDFTVR